MENNIFPVIFVADLRQKARRAGWMYLIHYKIFRTNFQEADPPYEAFSLLILTKLILFSDMQKNYHFFLHISKKNIILSKAIK